MFQFRNHKKIGGGIEINTINTLKKNWIDIHKFFNVIIFNIKPKHLPTTYRKGSTIVRNF